MDSIEPTGADSALRSVTARDRFLGCLLSGASLPRPVEREARNQLERFIRFNFA